MKIAHYVQNNVVVVNLQGDLIDSSVPVVNQYFSTIMKDLGKQKETKALLIDFGGVDAIDSVGIGLLCGKCVSIKKMNKKFALCNVARPIAKVFIVCNLENVFTIYTSVSVAINILGTPDQQFSRSPSDKPSSANNLNTFSEHKQRKHS